MPGSKRRWDNGSEYVNHTVARLLNKLLVEFTKSRPCRSLDNALGPEGTPGKNGAIIRKHMGWGHIPAEHAERIDPFHRKDLNPYLNFHRPCGFAQVVTDPRYPRKRPNRIPLTPPPPAPSSPTSAWLRRGKGAQSPPPSPASGSFLDWDMLRSLGGSPETRQLAASWANTVRPFEHVRTWC